VELCGTAEAVPFLVNVKIKVRGKALIKIKIKGKGVGRECPTHTSNVNGKIKGKGGATDVRGSHLSQKTRKMGQPHSWNCGQVA
jgi:hypothetical protein